MKSMTIRGIDERLEKALKQTALEKGISMNQLMVEALKGQLGLSKEKRFTRVYDDLDHLFGCWSQEEYEAIQGKIDAERVIDTELWE